MAIYHLNCKIISRNNGSNLLNSFAYQSCSKVHDFSTDQTFDYTHKHGHVAGGVVLPENAPESFNDPIMLMTSIENFEKSSNAQLARSFDMALPNELSSSEQIKLVEEFCQFLADQGMCVAWDIHKKHTKKKDMIDENVSLVDVDSQDLYLQNDHVHLKVSMREIDKKGNWLRKSCKAYLCRNSEGSEKYFTSEEIKNFSEGYEKVFKYANGDEQLRLTLSEAKKMGLEKNRINKYPVDKKIYLSTWNETEELVKWREQWAVVTNKYLELNGIDQRIDHRSYEEQGKDVIPQIHMGPDVLEIERKAQEKYFEEHDSLKGYEPVTDRAKINKEIRDLNVQLRTLEKHLVSTRKDLDQMKKVLRAMIDLEREKSFIQYDGSYTQEQRNHFNSLYDAQYKQYELAYKHHQHVFLEAYKELNTTDQDYANFLIQQLNKKVYVEDYDETFKNLEHESLPQNYAYDIYQIALNQPVIKDVTVDELERMCNESEETILIVKELQKDYQSAEQKIEESESKLKSLNMFNDFGSKKRDAVREEIESRKDEMKSIDGTVDELVEDVTGEQRVDLSFSQKIKMLCDYLLEEIDIFREIIQEYKKRLVGMAVAIKNAFGFDIDIHTGQIKMSLNKKMERAKQKLDGSQSIVKKKYKSQQKENEFNLKIKNSKQKESLEDIER